MTKLVIGTYQKYLITLVEITPMLSSENIAQLVEFSNSNHQIKVIYIS